MKKISTLLFAFLAAFAVNAQTIDLDGTVWTDFDGKTHDLGQLQDDGYTIVFDFWATWCGPCLGSIPGMEKLMDEKGPLGDQTYIVFSVETDQSTNDEAQIIEQYGISNPVIIEEDNMPSLIGEFDYGGSIPYFVTVCPDGTWSSTTGGIGDNPTPLLSNCSLPSTVVNDARLSYDGSDEIVVCEGELHEAEGILKNIGSNALSSATIDVSVAGTVVETIDWTGNLAKFEEETVSASVDLGSNSSATVEFTLTSINAGSDENALNNKVDFELNGGDEINFIDLIINVYTDYYPGETSWELKNSAGVVVASASYAPGTGDDFNGGGADALKKHTHTATLSSNECFSFVMTDSFGDGMSPYGQNTNQEPITYTEPLGYEILAASNNEVLFDRVVPNTEPFSFSETSDNMKVGDVTGIKDENLLSSFNVFPNPATDVLNVEVVSNGNIDVQVELINVLGKVVGSTSSSNGVATFNTSKILSGVYFVNVKENGASIATSSVVIR